MQYRTDERTNTELSALGFGCMRLPRESEAEKLILEALEQGVNYFDTAYAYPGSEEMLGRIITRNSLRDRMLLATKLPQSKVKAAADIERMFSTSLKRLQTDHIDYYLMHNMVSLDQWQRLLDFGIEEWIAQKKASGQIRRIGFSFHGTLPEFKKILNAYDWDFVQIQYNYVNEHYQAGREGLMLAAEKGLPVIIMEPLLGGRLVNGLPSGARKALKAVQPQASFAAWGLRWLWDQPQVTCVLSGMNAPEQLADNLAIASSAQVGCLSAEEHAALEAAKESFKAGFKVPCTGCNYCMPCPKGISIPASFAAYNESFTVGWKTGVWNYMLSAGIQSQEPHFVSNCIECGKCVRQCPQHIQIPDELKKVRKRLEPKIFRPVIKLIKPFI